jgi:hypothetical protein
MSEYSLIAAKRFHQYKRQKRKESVIHFAMCLVLRILHQLILILQKAGIKSLPRAEKINVEGEEPYG